jgi:uncharacterized protein (UPF0332 family)
MKEYSSKLFSKALDAIEAAEALLKVDKAEFAAGRAYYAMFYVAEALLYNEFDLKFSQHGRLLLRMERILPRPRRSTQNFTVG